MSELERARAHLLAVQRDLAKVRWGGLLAGRIQESYENAFIAALEWVWAEQEKLRLEDFVQIELDWHTFPFAGALK